MDSRIEDLRKQYEKIENEEAKKLIEELQKELKIVMEYQKFLLESQERYKKWSKRTLIIVSLTMLNWGYSLVILFGRLIFDLF